MAQPFVKWPGGKQRLVPAIRASLPVTYRRYYEPFLGGGALFFHLLPKTAATLVDSNERLIRTYRTVRDDVDSLIALLQQHQGNHSTEYFYNMRARDIDSRSDLEVAAWLLYLNRTAFNGMYRVNRSNQFNVPIGRYANPTVCNPDRLRECSMALAGTEILCEDFMQACDYVEEGDLVYFDPPYIPISASSSFVAFGPTGFSMQDQTRLRDLAVDLSRRGASVVLSNSWCDDTLRLYGSEAPPGMFRIQSVSVQRAVGASARTRIAVREALIVATQGRPERGGCSV